MFKYFLMESQIVNSKSGLFDSKILLLSTRFMIVLLTHYNPVASMWLGNIRFWGGYKPFQIPWIISSRKQPHGMMHWPRNVFSKSEANQFICFYVAWISFLLFKSSWVREASKMAFCKLVFLVSIHLITYPLFLKNSEIIDIEP